MLNPSQPQSQLQLQSQPRKIIIIKPYPIDSTVANELLAALDDELALIYPDWEDLPHPGFRQGFVAGDPSHHKTNSVQGLVADEGDGADVPVLTALDADDIGVSVNGTGAVAGTDDDGSLANMNEHQPLAMKDLTAEQINKLHFHVAFDVTDIQEYIQDLSHDDKTNPRPPSSSSSSSPAGQPVGCIGLKIMPYFPHHRAQPSGTNNPSATTTTTTPTPTTPKPVIRHAEIKRLYIIPSHRGALVQTSAHQHAQKLAPILLSTATTYAKQHLRIDRLVVSTGTRQHAAVKLYERLGWRKTAEFGDYVGAGVGDGGVSLCFDLDV